MQDLESISQTREVITADGLEFQAIGALASLMIPFSRLESDDPAGAYSAAVAAVKEYSNLESSIQELTNCNHFLCLRASEIEKMSVGFPVRQYAAGSLLAEAIRKRLERTGNNHNTIRSSYNGDGLAVALADNTVPPVDVRNITSSLLVAGEFNSIVNALIFNAARKLDEHGYGFIAGKTKLDEPSKRTLSFYGFELKGIPKDNRMFIVFVEQDRKNIGTIYYLSGIHTTFSRSNSYFCLEEGEIALKFAESLIMADRGISPERSYFYKNSLA